MKRRMLGTFGVLLAGAALLAGCGKSSSSSSNSGAKDAKKFRTLRQLQLPRRAAASLSQKKLTRQSRVFS